MVYDFLARFVMHSRVHAHCDQASFHEDDIDPAYCFSRPAAQKQARHLDQHSDSDVVYRHHHNSSADKGFPGEGGQ